MDPRQTLTGLFAAAASDPCASPRQLRPNNVRSPSLGLYKDRTSALLEQRNRRLLMMVHLRHPTFALPFRRHRRSQGVAAALEPGATTSMWKQREPSPSEPGRRVVSPRPPYFQVSGPCTALSEACCQALCVAIRTTHAIFEKTFREHDSDSVRPVKFCGPESRGARCGRFGRVEAT